MKPKPGPSDEARDLPPDIPPTWQTLSGIPLRVHYGPKDVGESAATAAQPGAFPYARGIHADMYRGKQWTMRIIRDMVQAIHQGYPQMEISASAFRHQQELERHERIIVGVNRYQEAEYPSSLRSRSRPTWSVSRWNESAPCAPAAMRAKPLLP